MTHSDLLFVGLPSTGKTSYLALLYLSIVNDRADGVRLGSFQDDREYVNHIAEGLARCDAPDHTEVDEQGELALSLTIHETELFLRIPDLSGERWEHVLDDRGWGVDLDQQVESASGFLVFVHADNIETGVTIADVNAAAQALGLPDQKADPTVDTSDLAPPDEARADLDSDDTGADSVRRVRATQVSLVDFVQMLATRRVTRPLAIGLVVSAWDTVKKLTPREWVRVTLPLFDQFVEANSNWLEFEVWGISAQGGDFENHEDRQRLLPLDAIDRSRTVASNGDPASITQPLTWALKLG